MRFAGRLTISLICPTIAAVALASWRKKVLAPHAASDDPVLIAWTGCGLSYQIPLSYVQQFIDGVARDLRQTRYATFDELAGYAYGVASTVGLMSMRIIGFVDPQRYYMPSSWAWLCN